MGFKLAEPKSGGSPLRPTRIGVREASTFPGFCASHDSTAFRPLETGDLVPTQEQLFLLAYRATCQELHKKRRTLEYIDEARTMDAGWPMWKKMRFQGNANYLRQGNEYGVRDLEGEKSRLDAQLLARDFMAMHALVVRFDGAPPVLAASKITPDRDFHGAVLQNMNLLSTVWESGAVAALPQETGWVWVLTWADPSPSARRLAESAANLPPESSADRLLRYTFQESENVFWSPQWWRDLDERHRQEVERWMHAGISLPLSYADKDCPRVCGQPRVSVSWL